MTNIPKLNLSDDDKAALKELQSKLVYGNIFDAVTDDKDEAAKMKEHADMLLALRRLVPLNQMCDTLRSFGILSIRGDAANYWARLVINGIDEVCTTLDSGYDHQSVEDAVYALFQSLTEWSLKA